MSNITCPQCDFHTELYLLCTDPDYDLICEVCAWQLQKNFDLVGSIMAFEDGTLEPDDVLRLFSHLVRSGQAWTLQGSYGRAAARMIEAGHLNEQGTILKRIGDDDE